MIDIKENFLIISCIQEHSIIVNIVIIVTFFASNFLITNEIVLNILQETKNITYTTSKRLWIV